jgi:hypothetical protein
MAVLTGAGTAVTLWLGGTPLAAGFFLGAAFSALNFWLWHRLVRRIGETSAEDGEPRKGAGALFGARYLLFGLAGYAILKYFEASLFAALMGCFIAVAAVILEILFELIYGT